MKYKILFIFMIFIIAASVFIVGINDQGNFNQRYHQHKEADPDSVTNLDFSADFKTHLPVIKIETNGQRIPGAPIFTDGENYAYELSETGESEIKASLTFYEGNKEPLHISGLIHYRGNSSRLSRKQFPFF